MGLPVVQGTLGLGLSNHQNSHTACCNALIFTRSNEGWGLTLGSHSGKFLGY